MIKKAKYELIINRSTSYSFVTISKDDEECIKLLKTRAEEKVYKNNVTYKIMKIQNGINQLLYKGRIKSSY